MAQPTATDFSVENFGGSTAATAGVAAVTTQLSLDADVSEIALHAGVTNYGYTMTRDLRANTLSLTIVTK